MKEADIRPKPLLDEFFRRLKHDADRLARRRPQFVDVDCPFCGDRDAEQAFEKDGFPYAECRACASLFASPRPTAEALGDYARTSEAVEYWSTHFYKETAEARRVQMFRPRAVLAVDLVRRGLVPAQGRFADIGAGYGVFLEEVRALNAFGEVIGIEPDARLAAISRERGFTIVEHTIEEIPAGSLAVDLATAFEVIEHVFDPLAFLRACAAVLAPGGVLLFTTLTASGFDIQVLWEESRSVTPPQHLNFGSIAGLERLIARAGLEQISVTTPGRLDVDIVRNRVEADLSLPVSRFARSLVRASDDVRAAFQQFLAGNRLSSHVQCIVRKPA